MRAHHAARTLAAVAVLMLCASTSASAHTAEIKIQESTLIYQQFPGLFPNHNNEVTISENTDSTGTYYVVADPESTGMFFPAQCTPLNTDQEIVRCPAAGISALYVRTGNATHESPTRHASITITAATPATVSGGSAVLNAGTSNVTVGPVGGNVLYGSLGGGTLNSKNGFVDFVHTCPSANTIEADLNDILIPDCAVIPEPPGTPPPSAGKTTPAPSSPGSTPTPTPSGELSAAVAPSSVVAVTYTQPQAVLHRHYVVLTVSVAMALTVHVHGSIALPGVRRPLTLIGTVARLGAAGATSEVRLLVPKRSLKLLRRAFARHEHLYASVRLEAASAASLTSYSLARRVRIVP